MISKNSSVALLPAGETFYVCLSHEKLTEIMILCQAQKPRGSYVHLHIPSKPFSEMWDLSSDKQIHERQTLFSKALPVIKHLNNKIFWKKRYYFSSLFFFHRLPFFGEKNYFDFLISFSSFFFLFLCVWIKYYRDEGLNYILVLGPWPRTWGDPRTNKR